MANISNNSSYQGPSTAAPYNPGAAAISIGNMLRNYGNNTPQQQVTAQQDNYRNQALGQIAGQYKYGFQNPIPTEQAFFPAIGAQTDSQSLPPDYSGFVSGHTVGDPTGDTGSITTIDPQTPRIQNLGGDVTGQYINDKANPGQLVKSQRGYTELENKMILGGRPGSIYQIDHIVPLELGGADTMGNREVLTPSQNDQKTKAQAVPYTLYAHGQISLNAARTMAAQWKDRDLTDIPEPDNLGMVPLDVAQQVDTRWQTQLVSPKVANQNFWSAIPETAKDFGKGSMPDWAREFVKGFGSGATLGFIPYQQGENEGTGAKIAGMAGMVAGGLGSFAIGGEVVDGVLGALGLGGRALGLMSGVARGGLTRFGLAAGVDAAEATGEGIAADAAATGTKAAFKSLNTPPSYWQKLLTPQVLGRAAKLGATNALLGQGQEFIANHMNPAILSGQQPEGQEEHPILKILGDLSVGAISGVASPTIKGSALAITAPMMLTAMENPTIPGFEQALTNGAIFGALHLSGALPSKLLSGKTAIDTVTGAGLTSRQDQMNAAAQMFDDEATRAAYTSLRYYAPDVLPALKGDTVPSQGETDINTVINTRAAAVKSLQQRFFTETEPDGTPSPSPMSLKTYTDEMKRIVIASRQLYKRGVPAELRGQMNVDDALSYTSAMKTKRFQALENVSQPPIAAQAAAGLEDHMMQTSFHDGNFDQNSGTYPTGDMALTGAGIAANTPEAKYYFAKKAAGQASPTILLVDRPDTGPVWSMKNDIYTADQLTTQPGSAGPKFTKDAKPDHALQAFGITIGDKGQREVIPLGWAASDGRTNLNANAFNQHPAVLKYAATNGAEGLPPIRLSKDPVTASMRANGLRVLAVNIDPRATSATTESGLPFIPVTMNDQNWSYSKQLGDKLNLKQQPDSLSMNVARVRTALDSKQKSAAITQIRQQVQMPASQVVPHSPGPASLSVPVSIPQEVTRDMLATFEDALKSENPGALQEAFKTTLGITLSDTEAQQVYANRNSMTVRDQFGLLDSAIKNGNTDGRIDVTVEHFVKPYLTSKSFQNTQLGPVFGDLKTLGGVSSQGELSSKDIANLKKQGFDDVTIQRLKHRAAQPAAAPATVDPATEDVAPAAAPQDTTITQANEPQAPTGGIEDRIVQSAATELPPTQSSRIIRQGQTETTVKPNTDTPKVRSAIDSFVGQGKQAIDAIAPGSNLSGFQLSDFGTPMIGEINKMDDQIQAALQSKGYTPAEIDAVKGQVHSELETYAHGRVGDLSKSTGEETDDFLRNGGTLDENRNKLTADEVDEMRKAGKTDEEIKQAKADAAAAPAELTKDEVIGRAFNTKKNAPIPRPEVHSSDFINNIEENLKDKSNVPAYYSAEAKDTALKTLFGATYKTNPEARKFLSTIAPEGKSFWNNLFANEVGPTGKPIEQPKDATNALARNDMSGFIKAVSNRNAQHAAEPTEVGGGSMSDSDKTNLTDQGYEPEMMQGMRVTPEKQLKDMNHDLTYGESRLMPGIASDEPMSGQLAVRDVLNLFANKDTGLVAQVNAWRKQSGQKVLSPDVVKSMMTKLKALADTAAKDDKKTSEEATKTQTTVQSAKNELEPLQKRFKALSKALETAPDEHIEQALNDTVAQMEELTKIITPKVTEKASTIKKPSPKSYLPSTEDIMKMSSGKLTK